MCPTNALVQALAVGGASAATSALERYLPPALLHRWRHAGCPVDMPPLLVPVPPWIAMKQPLVQHATRSKGTAAAPAQDTLAAAETQHDGHTPRNAVPGSDAVPNADEDVALRAAESQQEDADTSPPPPSTPPKGAQGEASVQVMACGYAWCALAGHFPLAGTHFQHNEVFLDTSSVLYHIRVLERMDGCVPLIHIDT